MDSFLAKFRVQSVVEPDTGPSVKINLYLIGDDPEENRYFWQGEPGTPAGTIQLIMADPEAIAYFELGKEFQVSFTAAEAQP